MFSIERTLKKIIKVIMEGWEEVMVVEEDTLGLRGNIPVPIAVKIPRLAP